MRKESGAIDVNGYARNLPGNGPLDYYLLHLNNVINSKLQHFWLVGWLFVLRINVDLAIFQPYLDLEAGDNQSLKIQVARPGIETRSSCSASQELNHSAIAALAFLSRYHTRPRTGFTGSGTIFSLVTTAGRLNRER